MENYQDKPERIWYNADTEGDGFLFPSVISGPQDGRTARLITKGKCDMVKQVKISSFNEVKSIVAAATLCMDQIGVHDQQGSIADAKSILGMMSLDYTKPVLLVSENPSELERVYEALHN